MKERPIIMTAESVRAILAGRKTQTRRVVKPQPECGSWSAPVWYPDYPGLCKRARAYACEQHMRRGLAEDFTPYPVGSLMWVREAWRVGIEDDDLPAREVEPVSVWYAADGYFRVLDDRLPSGPMTIEDGGLGRPRSPIHMPRWSSRIMLEVVSVRAERLQEINEADAVAEGYGDDVDAAVANYAAAWDRINGKRPGCAWDDDPWIWCIAFKPADLRVREYPTTERSE